MQYIFEDYCLDTALYELRYREEARKLELRAFDVLVYLIAHRDHVVSRDELLEAVWPGQCISEAMLNNCVMAARKAIGDTGQEQQRIKTLYSRGYRFIAPVEERLSARLPEEIPVLCDADAAYSSHSDQEGRATLESIGQELTAQNVLPQEYCLGTVLYGTFEPVHGLNVPSSVGIVPSLRRRFFTLVHNAARQHNGHHKWLGPDGVLMLFTGEEHAPRAFQVAEVLQYNVLTFTGADSASRPVETTMSVALHTGPLPLPCMTPAQWLLAPTHETTVVLTLWLHALARPGKLVASKATLAFFPDSIHWVEQGVVHRPGYTEAISAYQKRSS